ncbi:DUF2807 domain-containing protein [Bacteroidia bacterium]|nr:DUF2807 domain-containing protein [Bacteroidia bacterium]GHU83953.1 DUF2807 domain-containing protein [Bacteroidia bacterium]
MKRFTLFFISLFITFPFFVSCIITGNGPIYGNHQLVNRTLDVTDYDEISLNVPAEVYYQQFSDSVPYLQIHTDENIFASLDVEVKGKKLIISVKKDSVIRPSKLTIYTCSHNIKDVKVAGSGNIHLEGEVNARNFDLTITGSGSLIADSLVCENIEAIITGSGNAELTGVSKKSSFTITGSGNIHAFNYYVTQSKCKVTGSGDIQVNAYEKLDASVTGSGSIYYQGMPETVNSKITGSGKIKQE